VEDYVVADRELEVPEGSLLELEEDDEALEDDVMGGRGCPV
jgi:hypothetical protein